MSEPPRPEAPEGHVATSYQEALRRRVPLQDPDGTLSYPSARSRPKPDFTLDPFHRALLGISVVVPVLLTVLVAIQAPSMPGQVPVHFSLDGSVNRYGSPWEGLWTALGVTVIILVVAVLARFPRIFNYPVELTSRNVQSQYENAVQMMVWLNVSMAVTAVGIVSLWFQLRWFGVVWAGLVLMVVVMGFFIRRMLRLR